jgi:hypothetical protein
VHRLLRGQCELCLLHLTLELTQCMEVGQDVCTSILLVLLDKIFNDTIVEVFSTKMGITSSRQNLEDTIIDQQEREMY